MAEARGTERYREVPRGTERYREVPRVTNATETGFQMREKDCLR